MHKHIYGNFYNYVDTSFYKSIICLDGTIPEKEFFSLFTLPIIAVDGASNKLEVIGVEYDIVIGDLDSASDAIINSNKAVYLPSQDMSDFQKTNLYLAQKSLLPAIIVGINGGRLDHILYNINIFSNMDSVFFAPPLMGKIIAAGTTERVSIPYMTKISIIALSPSFLVTKGLKWELNQDMELNFGGMQSCFNRTIDDIVNISVISGKVLLLIYCDDETDCGVN